MSHLPFGCQPARIVFVELAKISDSCIERMGKTLTHVLMLCQSLRATRRITHFALESIAFTAIQLIPFQHMNWHQLDHVYSILQKLTSYKSGHQMMETIDYKKNILLALNRLIQESNEMTLNIVYVTGRSKQQVVDDLCHVFSKTQVIQLNKLNVLLVESQNKQKQTQDSHKEIPDVLKNVFEVNEINDDEFSFEAFFKLWFHDAHNETEFLRISFNSSPFVIKCDVHEAIVDVNRISVMSLHGLCNDLGNMQMIPSSMASGEQIPIYELVAVGLIQRKGLCDSVIFGNPYILSPTHCWTMEWTEAETNIQRFTALCHAINEREAVLVLKLNSTSGPTLFYALFASSDARTLLIKSVATKELLLPYSNELKDTCIQTPDPAIIQSVNQLLDQFRCAEIFNPLLVESNLYDFLSPKK